MMKYRTGIIALVCLLLVSCAVTKHLPEEEILYTGSKNIIIPPTVETAEQEEVVAEIAAALKKKPSTKMFGVLPIPFGLWVYDHFGKYERGFGKWIFNRFAADPVYISTVNPDVRVQAATNVLRDNGYFRGAVSYQIIPDQKDSLKASVHYTIDMRNPYFIDTLAYERFNPTVQRIIDKRRRASNIQPNSQFSVAELDAERERVSSLLRNRGFYYFRPDYLTFMADTTLVPGGHVSLKMVPVAGLPPEAQRRYFVGSASVFLYGKNGEKPNDSVNYKGIDIHYYDKLQIRPAMLYRWLNYQSFVRNDSLRQTVTGRRYSQYRHQRIQERLAQLGIFRYMDLKYVLRDTTALCDTLDFRFTATFDKPLDAELELNIKTKSNDQTGPGASFSLTRYNVFGGGETWNIELKGAYEWQTGGNKSSSLMNSWDFGLSTSLVFPRVLFPTFGDTEYDFPAMTTFELSAEQLNRARFYKMLSFGGNATYDFQPTRVSRHSFTPFKLTFNVLQNHTAAFDSITNANKALFLSMQNQFIPAMEYTYTFDNAAVRSREKTSFWWQTSVVSAGNITSCIYKAFGEPFNKEGKNLLNAPFAQFVKLNTDFRYLWKIDRNNALAARLAGGIVASYGNSTVAPYSEQFYVGGANSIRAFTVRSIGPGGYRPEESDYSYLDQTGDIRLEANLEYRFRIYEGLHGAVFLDAGNVWLLRNDPERPDSQFRLSTFANQIALGTGAGLRYDLDFLVFRLDCGIPLHAPYDTGESGYYNITGSFWKQLGLHFAIGYPF